MKSIDIADVHIDKLVEVNISAETTALLKLLQLSKEDIKAGRVYTEEQIREEIFKDCDQD
jgi:uncharacterized protein YqfA (UPF0365 family)